MRERIEIPYGLQASPDGFYLEDRPDERRVLMFILNAVVDDRPLSGISADLNHAGFVTRQGKPWSAAAVFELLPLLIDSSPKLFASPDWIAQREKREKRA